MQCIWNSFGRIPSNGLGRGLTFFSSARPSASWVPPHNKTSYISKTTSSPTRSLNTKTSSHSVRPPRLSSTNPTPPFPYSPNHTSPSRLALSATKVVHASLRAHAIEDAVTIVNTIRYAALPDAQRKNKNWDTIKRTQVAIPPGVSPRLPAHALLHGLVRIGLSQQASHLATSMMESGIRVRARTLHGIVDGLAKSATIKNALSEASNARLRGHMESLLGTPKILELDHLNPSNPNIAFALKLLQAAKKSRSKRTSAMFNTLITLCLINGEIIIASLLFGLLVKDWENRSSTLTQMTSPATSESTVEPSPPPSERLEKAYLYHLSTRDLRPTPGMMKAILSPIRERLTQAIPDDTNSPDFQEALQALANLSALLNNLQLPFPQLSSLIRTLSRCPLVENWVWVMGKEGPIHVPAYQYLHQTLLHLATYPPTHQLSRRTSTLRHPIVSIKFSLPHHDQHMQPPMDLPSYNTLIHYALRHRFSPPLARKLYEHMTVRRDQPLQATSDTHSIFLRSAALCRQRDVIERAVEILRQYGTDDIWQNVSLARPTLFQVPRKLKRATEVIEVPLVPSVKEILQDLYTLATYLSTLISCGQPGLVVQLMRVLLPVFQIRPLPRPQAPKDEAMKQAWDESLARAMRFGPYVLNIFLHALVKSNMTKETHVLFRLTACASHASQHSAMPNGNMSWRVPPTIYTTMLQAYKKEFDTYRRRAGTRALSSLLRKATDLYRMAKSDMTQNVPGAGRLDSRFYNALFKILSQGLPVKQYDPTEASRCLVEARHKYAETGLVNDRGRTPLMEEVIADMNLAGYPIPTGYHHLFLTEGAGLLSSSYGIPELDRRPYAFPKSKKSGTPYTLPVKNRRLLPLRSHRRIRRL